MTQTLLYLQEKYEQADNGYWKAFDRKVDIEGKLKQLQLELKSVEAELEKHVKERNTFQTLIQELECI